MTQICVSLTETTTDALVDRMVDLAPVADLFEIRADLVEQLDLLTLLRTRSRPLLFTCRPPALGGRFTRGEEARRLLLLEAVKRGFDYVDVEHDSGFGDVMVDKAGRGLVLSHHDFQRTPGDLPGLYERMCSLGADIVKIAVMPRGVADVGRLMELGAQVARRDEVPLVPVAMGPMGLVTRLTAGRHGALFTFASAAPGAETGPGQIPAAWMRDVYRVRHVTRATKVYGVVGRNVTASLSPALHNAAFAARDVDAIYVPLQAEALAPFLGALPALGLDGFSVTRPYKTEILAHLHEVEESAALAGSANTVWVHDGLLRGSTSDGVGVLAPLRRHVDLKGRRVVVLGAGGAARSAALALVRRGARVTLLARRPEQAAEAAAAAGAAHGDLARIADYEWDVLLNATPLGSLEAPETTPVPAELHRPGSVVFDMVYAPLATRLLREARAAGCATIDGLEMLVAQAAPQFEAWTGLEAPVDVMRQAGLDFVARAGGAP
jgi:3-dehydroquinate dehydratase/shikimate dehydrogenase